MRRIVAVALRQRRVGQEPADGMLRRPRPEQRTAMRWRMGVSGLGVRDEEWYQRAQNTFEVCVCNRVERYWLNNVKVVNIRPLGAFTELACVGCRRHYARTATFDQVVQAGAFKVSVPRRL
jgi:hypothetical protein